MENINQGNRYNEGKPRLSLIPAHAELEFAKVLTYGAKKYAPNNWMKGLPWSETLDSLMRHVNAFRMGEDFDPESGHLHMAHVMCNAAYLIEFYHMHQKGDDRPHDLLKKN